MAAEQSSSPPEKRTGKWTYILRLTRKILLVFFASTIFVTVVFRFINPPVTWLMVQRGFERMAAGKEWKLEKKWRSFDELPDNLKRAAIGGEDATFMTHWGFDLKGIEYAYKKIQKNSRLRGGSTISQQTAKNVFLWPSRFLPLLWIRKGFEVYFTGLIELLWSKQRILEVYLNVVETGDGLYGVEAASQKYFGKSASDLNRSEASLLIAILPSPRRWSAVNPTRFVYYKQSLILRNMKDIGKLEF